MIFEKKWYALLTRSRFENVVTDAINRKSIEVFLPKIKVRSRRKDRKQIIETPLFPGYTFVNITLNPTEHLNVVKTIGAVRLLGSHKGPVPVPDGHIAALRLITSAATEVVTGSSGALHGGDTVLVVNGPMSGLKGEFVNYKGKDRVIIRIDALNQFAGVEIDADDIEKLPAINF